MKTAKTVKILSLVLISTLLFSIFSGCSFTRMFSGPQEKQFSKSGLTITLTDEFSENDSSTMTALYSSQEYVVAVLKEEFTLLEQAGIATDISETEYAQIVLTNNSIEGSPTTEDGLVTISYEMEANGKNMSYWGVAKKGSDAFWLVQFVCESDIFEESKPQFVEWAQTITIE